MSHTPFHRPRAVLLGLNLALPAVTIAAGFPWPLMWCSFAVHSALFYALMAPWCHWLGPAAERFETQKREVWLTIDDGPDGDRTVQLAGALAARGVRATFFVKGARLAEQPDSGRALLRGGHTLANHTATHPIGAFACLPIRRLRREIDDCNAALREAGVAVTRWFRPPLGFKHFWLHSVLRQRGMRLVMWNVRAHDGVVCEPKNILRRIRKRVAPGAVILLHEGRPRSNEAILQVVDALLADGYSFTIPADEQLR